MTRPIRQHYQTSHETTERGGLGEENDDKAPAYDWEQDAKDCYTLAVAKKREQWLVENIPGVKRAAVIGRCELLMGNCLEIMPHLEKVDSVITDPPYEAVMQKKWGVLSSQAPSSHVRYENLDFSAIDEIRQEVAEKSVALCRGWFIAFCMAEGVRAWRDEIEAVGARYKRALVWVKPDAMPQFNGQGPSVGHEMMVSAWCGKGRSSWNGGGKPGTFIYNKNTPGGGVHPTQKPLPLISELVRLFSNASDTVLDPFMGSGTTLYACAKLGRRGIGIEMNEAHFDTATQRVEEAYRQPDLFVEPPAAPVQTSIFDEAAE